jgi:NFU1 iron-sulfur cluster scaffold homolog, mitochondrial
MMAFKVIDIQPTPNPNAAKFVLDGQIAPQPTSFFNAEQAKGHDLATRLFAIDGVASVLLLGDFVTVNKRAETKWSAITDKIQSVLQSG